MTDSLAPQPENDKRALFLLIGGGVATLALLGGLAFVLGGDRTPPPPPPPPPTVAVARPGPLVTPDATALAATDAGLPPVVVIETTTPKRGPTIPLEPLGTIDAAKVNAVLRENDVEIRGCYERRLKVDALLQGQLDFSIGVSSEGKVTSIGVSQDTLRDEEVTACVKRLLRKLKLPKPEGGRVVIAKAYTFRPKT